MQNILEYGGVQHDVPVVGHKKIVSGWIQILDSGNCVGRHTAFYNLLVDVPHHLLLEVIHCADAPDFRTYILHVSVRKGERGQQWK